MNQLAAICDSSQAAHCIREHLEGVFETECIPSDRLLEARPPGQYTTVDIDLTDSDRVRDLKRWLTRRPKHAKVVFIIERGSRVELVRAFAVGATDFVHRPIATSALLTKLRDDFKSLASSPATFQAEASPGIVAALEALQEAFASAWLGAPLDKVAVEGAGEAIVDQIHTGGLPPWIETVREHHSQTYQHSLLVTGLAVGFGRLLGFSHADKKRLAFAGILHDVGKAKVPVSVLEKPGALDDDEMGIIKQHPLFGSEALATVPGLPAEMIDATLHHHEYLDGTGYPHRLKGSEISDFVRILTIADIFGALIERRSYKPPLSGEAAYRVLLDMGPKLDRDLVREFRSISHMNVAAW
jgi:HD-GYP domain-containing protein (c-di-GMP phosphodiesterase class II)